MKIKNAIVLTIAAIAPFATALMADPGCRVYTWSSLYAYAYGLPGAFVKFCDFDVFGNPPATYFGAPTDPGPYYFSGTEPPFSNGTGPYAMGVLSPGASAVTNVPVYLRQAVIFTYYVNSGGVTNWNSDLSGWVAVDLVSNSWVWCSSPYDDGTNTVTSLLGTYLPSGSIVGVLANSDTGAMAYSTNVSGAWSDDFYILPGTGFSVFTTTNLTLMFAGALDTPMGGFITNHLNPGYNFVGSALPFDGDLVESNYYNLGAILPNKSSVQTLNVESQTPNVLTKGGGGFSGDLYLTNGTAFFIRVAGTNGVDWVEHLQTNYPAIYNDD